MSATEAEYIAALKATTEAVWIRKFISGLGCGLIAKQLTDFSMKNGFLWDEEAQLAFEKLMLALTTVPVLQLPNFHKHFAVDRLKSSYDRELLALVLALQKWRHYLLARQIFMKMDHFSLKHLLAQRVTTREHKCLLMKLPPFNFTIIYKAEKENQGADALLRSPQHGKIPQHVAENRQQPQSSSSSSSLQVSTTGLKKLLPVSIGTVTAYSICVMPEDMKHFWSYSNTKKRVLLKIFFFLPFILMIFYVSVVGFGNLERFVNISGIYKSNNISNPQMEQILDHVASESGKIYKVVSEGTQTFAAKFFEMKRYDAVIAMDIYKRTRMKAGRLCEFYKMCNSIGTGRGNEFIKIKQVLKQDAIGLILSLAIEIIMGHYGLETITILIYDEINLCVHLHNRKRWQMADERVTSVLGSRGKR
nr:retrotransposon-related protein [Tanacetum cinerariifolium]